MKRCITNVGHQVVQETVAARALARSREAVVITSRPGSTRAAQELAQANGVKRCDADDLFNTQTPPRARRPV